MLQRVAACCSVLQRVAACCSVLQHLCVVLRWLDRLHLFATGAAGIVETMHSACRVAAGLRRVASVAAVRCVASVAAVCCVATVAALCCR